MFGSALRYRADKCIFISLYIAFHTMMATTNGQLHCYREAMRSPFIAHYCCTVWLRVYLTSSLWHTRVLGAFSSLVLVIRDEYLPAYYDAYRCYHCLYHATGPSKLGFTFYYARSVYRRQTYGGLISDKTFCGWPLEQYTKKKWFDTLLTQILHCNRPLELYMPYRRIRVSDSRIKKYFK